MSKKPETWIGNEMVNRRVEPDALPALTPASKKQAAILAVLGKGEQASLAFLKFKAGVLSNRSILMTLRMLEKAGHVEAMNADRTLWRRKEASRAA